MLSSVESESLESLEFSSEQTLFSPPLSSSAKIISRTSSVVYRLFKRIQDYRVCFFTIIFNYVSIIFNYTSIIFNYAYRI